MAARSKVRLAEGRTMGRSASFAAGPGAVLWSAAWLAAAVAGAKADLRAQALRKVRARACGLSDEKLLEYLHSEVAAAKLTPQDIVKILSTKLVTRMPTTSTMKRRYQMGFERHGYQFEGAFTSPSELEARAGV